MKMLVLQMLVMILTVVALVWGLLSIKKWYSKVVLVTSVLFVGLFSYISFLNYENTKANVIECYKLGGCQNDYSSDFIINYEKNLLTKKLEDQINTKIKKNETEVKSETKSKFEDRPEKQVNNQITQDAQNAQGVEEVKMNQNTPAPEVKSEKEIKLQSIRNKEYKDYKEYK